MLTIDLSNFDSVLTLLFKLIDFSSSLLNMDDVTRHEEGARLSFKRFLDVELNLGLNDDNSFATNRSDGIMFLVIRYHY